MYEGSILKSETLEASVAGWLGRGAGLGPGGLGFGCGGATDLRNRVRSVREQTKITTSLINVAVEVVEVEV